MPKVPANFCLSCGYSLIGLPPRHRCPECGLEYDEHVQVWVPARPRRLLVWSVLVSLVASLQMVYSVLYIGIRGSSWWETVCGFLLLVLGLGFSIRDVRRFLGWRQGGFRISLSKRGIELLTDTVRETIGWEEFVRASRIKSRGRFGRWVRIELAGRKPVEFRSTLASAAETDEFIAAAENARRVYARLDRASSKEDRQTSPASA